LFFRSGIKAVDVCKFCCLLEIRRVGIKEVVGRGNDLTRYDSLVTSCYISVFKKSKTC
ncbi:unnamed protein product, partial [Musa banksii]